MSRTRDTRALRTDYILSAKELTQGLPNLYQSMPNLRSLQLSKDTTGERDQSIDPFGSLTPTLGYLKLVSFPLYPPAPPPQSPGKELAVYSGRFDLHLDNPIACSGV